jgi:hypothetical protein
LYLVNKAQHLKVIMFVSYKIQLNLIIFLE